MTVGIAAENLRFGYDKTPVVRDVDLQFPAGETVAIMGANGAGKTTLLKLLAGLLAPDSGSVTVPSECPVGFAPENPADALFEPTVEREIAFFPRNRGLDTGPRTQQAMQQMDVHHLRDRAPSSLSVGEQRRVSIAAVLSGSPDVIVLDEPTAGLDRRSEEALGRRLADLEATVVFSTHESDFAYAFADRVAVLDDGRVGRVGPVQSILTDFGFLQAVGIRPPGPVSWARREGFERPPADVTEAITLLEERS